MPKPKIKCIEIQRREWSDGRYGQMVVIDRWQNATEHDQYCTNHFFHPTNASIARCRRAQDGKPVLP